MSSISLPLAEVDKSSIIIATYVNQLFLNMLNMAADYDIGDWGEIDDTNADPIAMHTGTSFLSLTTEVDRLKLKYHIGEFAVKTRVGIVYCGGQKEFAKFKAVFPTASHIGLTDPKFDLNGKYDSICVVIDAQITDLLSKELSKTWDVDDENFSGAPVYNEQPIQGVDCKYIDLGTLYKPSIVSPFRGSFRCGGYWGKNTYPLIAIAHVLAYTEYDSYEIHVVSSTGDDKKIKELINAMILFSITSR